MRGTKLEARDDAAENGSVRYKRADAETETDGWKNCSVLNAFLKLVMSQLEDKAEKSRLQGIVKELTSWETIQEQSPVLRVSKTHFSSWSISRQPS